MKLHLSDSSRASFVGAALVAIAAYTVFGFRRGFEEQVGWYVTLFLEPFSLRRFLTSSERQSQVREGSRSGVYLSA
jgi:hypothetical protein